MPPQSRSLPEFDRSQDWKGLQPLASVVRIKPTPAGFLVVGNLNGYPIAHLFRFSRWGDGAAGMAMQMRERLNAYEESVVVGHPAQVDTVGIVAQDD